MFNLSFEQLLLCLAYAFLVFTGLRLLHLALCYRYPMYQRNSRLFFLSISLVFWMLAEIIVGWVLRIAIWRYNRQLRKSQKKFVKMHLEAKEREMLYCEKEERK